MRTVLFYGDVCEKPRLSYEAQVSLYSLLLRRKYRELDIHIIPGNHDFQENGSHSLQVLAKIAELTKTNVTVYTEPTVVKIERRRFNFLPHPFTETVRNALNIAHYEVAGSFRDNGRRVDDGLKTRHMGCYGHLHTCHRVRRVHYSGTLYQTNFGEALPKSFHHVRYDDDDPYSAQIENIPHEPPWKLINLPVKDESDLAAIEDNPDILYKLFVHEGLDLDINDVLKAHPNVVRHNRFNSKSDLKTLIENEWDFESQSVTNNVDTEEVVRDYLANKSGLNKREIERAFRFLSNIANQSAETVK